MALLGLVQQTQHPRLVFLLYLLPTSPPPQVRQSCWLLFPQMRALVVVGVKEASSTIMLFSYRLCENFPHVAQLCPYSFPTFSPLQTLTVEPG